MVAMATEQDGQKYRGGWTQELATGKWQWPSSSSSPDLLSSILANF
jgi:hypothetical protein